MFRFFVLCVWGLVFLFYGRAFAEPKQNPEMLQKLILRVIEEVDSEAAGPNGEYIRYLGHRVPDAETEPRTADYVSVLGIKEQGEFYPFSVHVISERWTLDEDKNWDLDQWIYILNISGDIIRFAHNLLKLTDYGRLLDFKTLPEPAEQAVYGLQLKLNEWFERLPQLATKKADCMAPREGKCIAI